MGDMYQTLDLLFTRPPPPFIDLLVFVAVHITYRGAAKKVNKKTKQTEKKHMKTAHAKNKQVTKK